MAAPLIFRMKTVVIQLSDHIENFLLFIQISIAPQAATFKILGLAKH